MDLKNAVAEAARVMDVFKVTRRTVLFCYGYLVWTTAQWMFALDAPTVEQAGFASAVIGGAALVFSFYTNAPNDWSKFVNNKKRRKSTTYDLEIETPPDDWLSKNIQ